MTDFITEQVNELNHSLLQTFEKQSVSSSTNNYGSSPPKHDIDLTSSTIDINVVKKNLKDLVDNNGITADNDVLDWLFIAKATVAVYGYMLRNILSSTLPLSEAIAYWNNIYGSKSREAYYTIQTLPIRVGYLGINTIKKVRTTDQIKTIFQSPRHTFFRSMFPLHAREWLSITSTEQRHLFNRKKYTNILSQLIHDEIRQKIDTLNDFRQQQATRLGLLIKMPPFLLYQNEEENFMSFIALQSNQWLQLTRYILKPLTTTAVENGLVDSFNVQHAFELVKNTKLPSSDDKMLLSSTAQGLIDIIDGWTSSEENIKTLRRLYEPPSLMTRYWIPCVLGLFATDAAIKWISHHQDDIIKWLKELGVTVKGFVINWVWKPILKVWDTIRLKDEMSMLKQDALKSDIDSLERMVAEFARDHYHLQTYQFDTIRENVHRGDMSLVLKAYEEEMKQPLKNAIRGDLVRALLIQIQKAKVDADLALAALDKLLKSNELNFAFLAVAPSMLISWGVLSWFNQMYQRQSGYRLGKIGLSIRSTMRRVERLFNISQIPQQQQKLDCETQGILLCEMHLLRCYAQYLPTRNSTRDLFMEDLRDLENPHLLVVQKIQTIERMYRTWAFLKPKSH